MKAKKYRNESAAEEIERVVQGAAKRSEEWRGVMVRLTPAEYKAMRIRAAHEETTVTAMVRDLVKAMLSKEK